MKKLKYTSKRGKTIVFDNYEEDYDVSGRLDEETPYWVDLCPHCHNKYKGILGNRICDGGSGVASCSVEGCLNTNACYYVDFTEEDVEVIA